MSTVSPFLWCAFFHTQFGKRLCFSSVRGRKGHYMTNKVKNKREQNIANAIKSGDWSKVDKTDYLLAMERSPIKDIEIKES